MPSTRVLMISGSHGSSDGYSALSKVHHSSGRAYLAQSFYELSCKMVGMDPVEENIVPENIEFTKSNWADPNSILEQPEFKDLKMFVLNIKHFSVPNNTSNNSNNREGLKDWVRRFNPTSILPKAVTERDSSPR